MYDETRNRRVAFVLGIFGLMSLLAMLTRPSLANVRAVDIVHLIGTGMCLGGALVAIAGTLRRNPR